MFEQAEHIKPAELKDEQGPWAGIDAFSGDEPVTVELNRPPGNQGTLMCWFRVDEPIVNGPFVEEADGDSMVELPGLGSLNLWWYSGYGGIVWETENGPNEPVEVPGVPGPQWVHVCYTWDADKGRSMGYIDGTPTKLSSQLNPWTNETAEEIVVDASRWTLAGLTTFDRMITEDEVRAAVPSIYRGGMDHTLGSQDLGELDTAKWRGDTVFEVPLDGPDQIAGWQMEGPGDVEIDDGWMKMWSREPDAEGNGGHIVHWCDQDVPSDFLLEFDVRILSDHGLNIIFFCAKGRNGEDVLDSSLDERTGIFGHYTGGDINCYHISYYANAPGGGGRTTSNMRKNSGFYLVDNGPIGIPPDDHDVHHVSLLKNGGMVRLAVDDRCVIDWYDDGQQYGPVLGDGKVAFRQMKWTTAEYRDLRVSRLEGDGS